MIDLNVNDSPARIRSWFRQLLATALIVLSLIESAHAIVTSGDPSLHRVIAGEQTYGLNLDGVGLIGWGDATSRSIEDVLAICTGAAISDRHLLTAAHCFDADANGEIDRNVARFPLVTFFELPTDATHAVNIAVSNIRLPDEWPNARADIAVIELSQTLPTSIPRYPAYGGFDEVGQPIVVAGYGMTSDGAIGVGVSADPGFRSPGKHAGMNQADAVLLVSDSEFISYDFDNGQLAQNALAYLGLESDLGLGIDEAMPAFGDSGGPVFINGAIAGVIALADRLDSSGIDVTDHTDSSWGELHLDTRVATFQHFLIDATGNAVSFVNLIGDFDNSGRRDTADIDLLSDAKRQASSDLVFDLDGNGSIGTSDLRWWIHRLMGTHFGDADLDGHFNSADLVRVFETGEFDDNLPLNSRWASGDWNGDSEFNTSDLMAAFEDGGYELGLPAKAQNAPEPTTALTVLIALLYILVDGQRRRNRGLRNGRSSTCRVFRG